MTTTTTSPTIRVRDCFGRLGSVVWVSERGVLVVFENGTGTLFSHEKFEDDFVVLHFSGEGVTA